MGSKKTLIADLEKFKKSVGKEIPLNQLIFFGSRARGKPRKWSDVDLILVSQKFSPLSFRERATKMHDFWKINYPVDFLCYTPKEFEKLKNQITIVREAVETGISI